MFPIGVILKILCEPCQTMEHVNFDVNEENLGQFTVKIGTDSHYCLLKLKSMHVKNFGILVNFTKNFSCIKLWVSIYRNDSYNELITSITL